MMGYKPVEDGFELKYGIFYRFCQKAANHPDKDYFFIIDEINRGNMSKIFGELLMLIEADYRETKAALAYNGLSFSVPKRLHIIGMMNTADRSLAMIDYALRRRFSFFDMEPGFDSKGFIKYQEGFANDTFNTLIDRIKELNREIAKDKSLGKGFCIGHSYFCNTDECTDEWMQDVVDFDVLPMLIIDAKYYSHTTQVQFDKHTLHSNNLYQIFTYVKNRSYQFGEKENTVSGMLLYAKTEEVQPDNVYQMHGSQISVKTLDLNLPFAEIASQMDRIVESHFSGLTKAY